MKSYPGCFGTQLLATREWFTFQQSNYFVSLGGGRTAVLHDPRQIDAMGRQLFDCQDLFATFATLANCFAKRAGMFGAGRYAPFAAAYRSTGDMEAYIRGIAPIYATAPNYADQLLEIINEPSVQAALTAAQS